MTARLRQIPSDKDRIGATIFTVNRRPSLGKNGSSGICCGPAVALHGIIKGTDIGTFELQKWAQMYSPESVFATGAHRRSDRMLSPLESFPSSILKGAECALSQPLPAS